MTEVIIDRKRGVAEHSVTQHRKAPRTLHPQLAILKLTDWLPGTNPST